jgi:hypothetical protein
LAVALAGLLTITTLPLASADLAHIDPNRLILERVPIDVVHVAEFQNPVPDTHLGDTSTPTVVSCPDPSPAGTIVCNTIGFLGPTIAFVGGQADVVVATARTEAEGGIVAANVAVAAANTAAGQAAFTANQLEGQAVDGVNAAIILGVGVANTGVDGANAVANTAIGFAGFAQQTAHNQCTANAPNAVRPQCEAI